MGAGSIYIGQMLDNRYEILEKIGAGGMAVVYKAMCHRLNRLVAIKVLRNELAQDESVRRRFRAESQAVAMMSHPNIVGIYDVCQSDGLEYIVMELIEGITLKQYIARKKVLTWKETLHFSIQITKALAHAHSRGIIHRDIKPHNIMILKDGTVKVADFGIAQVLKVQNTMAEKTTFGSVHYISPEQARGTHVDERSDLYSVGVVMYEMLTGTLPFKGDTPVSVALAHVNSIPPLPSAVNPNVPAGLEDITMHAMEPYPEMRYSSASELLKDLEEFRKNPNIVFDYPSSGDVAGDTRQFDTVAAPVQKPTPAPKPAPAPVRTQRSVPVPAEEPEEQLSLGQRFVRFMQSPPKEESYYKARRRAARTSMLVGTLSCVIFLVILFMFIWTYFLKDTFSKEDERVVVPYFMGNQIGTVTTNRDYLLYYNFDIEYAPSEVIPEGQILDQNPEPGRQMTIQNDGIDIVLTVSSGSEAVIMPNILNKDYRDAKITLENLNLGLDIILQDDFSEDVTVGYVVEQYPEAGSELARGSTVYITYSKGPEVITVEVPSVVGVSQGTAIMRLEANNLSYSVNLVEDDASYGTVVWQYPSAGSIVEVDTTVTINVSVGYYEPEGGGEEDNEGGEGGNQTGGEAGEGGGQGGGEIGGGGETGEGGNQGGTQGGEGGNQGGQTGGETGGEAGGATGGETGEVGGEVGGEG